VPSLSLVAAQTRNFTGISRERTGVYCLFADPSIDLSGAVALTTSDFAFVLISALVGGCSVGGVHGILINIMNPTSALPEDENFYVMIP
jgi:hypothetical protein